ncbi:carbohydrate-binding protein [Streptomyces sp. NPDC090442]|uniref:carbohydrate-binding protein n=1 Tax=Streptomyces sp. NPDC090442 TaxID=3365962 RepID=UPI0037FB2238
MAEVAKSAPLWGVGRSYSKGDVVVYQGKQYVCVDAHRSVAHWIPGTVPTLWAEGARQ